MTILYFVNMDNPVLIKPYLWLVEQGLYTEPFRVLASYAFWAKHPSIHSLFMERGFRDDYEMIIDSGAYTVWSNGSTISMAAYAKWLRHQLSASQSGSRTHFYFNLDVIGDAEGTLRNQALLEADGLNPIPVYHLMSNLDYLRRIVEKYDRFGIGGLKQIHGPELHRKLEAVYKITHAGKPKQVHGLAATNIETTWRYPFTTVDSSTWVNGNKYGRLLLYDDSRRKMHRVVLSDIRHVPKYSRLMDKLFEGKLSINRMYELWKTRGQEWLTISAAIGLYSCAKAIDHLNASNNGG